MKIKQELLYLGQRNTVIDLDPFALSKTDCERTLGVQFDDNVKFDKYINLTVIKSCFFHQCLPTEVKPSLSMPNHKL